MSLQRVVVVARSGSGGQRGKGRTGTHDRRQATGDASQAENGTRIANPTLPQPTHTCRTSGARASSSHTWLPLVDTRRFLCRRYALPSVVIPRRACILAASSIGIHHHHHHPPNAPNASSSTSFCLNIDNDFRHTQSVRRHRLIARSHGPHVESVGQPRKHLTGARPSIVTVHIKTRLPLSLRPYVPPVSRVLPGSRPKSAHSKRYPQPSQSLFCHQHRQLLSSQ